MPRLNLIVCALTGVCGAVLNILGSLCAKYFELPLFLDTYGTIAATLYGGFAAGCVAAALTNSAIVFIIANGETVYILYMLCNILTAYITEWFCRKILYRPVHERAVFPVNKQASTVRRFHAAIEVCIVLFLLSFALVIAMSVLGGLIAFFIDLFFKDNQYHNGNWKNIPGGWVLYGLVLSFSRHGAGSLATQILARLPINIPDRLISVFSAYLIFRLIPDNRRKT
ncbi:MAG: hypothetical protein Pg6A_17060 [Termitinemataceae bacterium]|nr:MAG: hypothetical protein Pg6A_17060 [Termitinemataceae bacterium]